MKILLVNWQDRDNPQGGGAEIHLHEIFGLRQDTAEARLRRIASDEQLKRAGIQVRGKAEITIHDDGTGKKHHVTTDLFPDFTTPAPQTKAKAKTHRGSP